jgi:hypothetical protein
VRGAAQVTAMRLDLPGPALVESVTGKRQCISRERGPGESGCAARHQVTCVGEGEPWTVGRRFSEFAGLRDRLQVGSCHSLNTTVLCGVLRDRWARRIRIVSARRIRVGTAAF